MAGVQASISGAAERHTKSPELKGEERFLQHFISDTLVQKMPTKDVEVATRKTQAMPTEQSVPPHQLPSQFTTATTTMILALGAILGLLGVGAYLIRRYLLTPSPFGKRGSVLRVLARVNVTPKAAVALLEVPGKLLVIGVTSSTLTALGEVPGSAVEDPEPAANTPSASFAAALDQHTQAPSRQDTADDPLLQMPEHIQRKVSRLKQL